MLYLGGIEPVTKLVKKTIYEYEGKSDGWRLWTNSLPVPVGNVTFIPVEKEFCETVKRDGKIKRV